MAQGREHDKETRVVSASGAEQTHVKERYDLICPSGLRRIALRYGLGAEKYADNNYCKGSGDRKFIRARLNHLIKHLNLYLLHGNFDEHGREDDNLAAVAWNAITLMHFEDGCKHHEADICKGDE